MKIVIVPDKFKGSLSSFEVCDALAQGIQGVNKKAVVQSFPMADGGDGFAAVMRHYYNTQQVLCDTVDPLGRPMQAGYEWDPRTGTVFIELASASGLVLLSHEERNPLHTSTRGTGIMIKDAISRSAKKIVLGLGGSATNDAGIGILSALGFTFLNSDDQPLVPNGQSLSSIARVNLPPALPAIEFIIASDVQNPLYGEQGAAYVYGPQKGADPDTVAQLDNGLKHFAELLKQFAGQDISTIAGTGAAGGVAAGLISFFKTEIKKGIQLVADASGVVDVIKDADLLITGEGKIDNQSAKGKVVGYLSGLAKKNNIPCRAICGFVELNKEELNDMGIEKVIALIDLAENREQSFSNAKTLIVSLAPRLLES